MLDNHVLYKVIPSMLPSDWLAVRNDPNHRVQAALRGDPMKQNVPWYYVVTAEISLWVCCLWI